MFGLESSLKFMYSTTKHSLTSTKLSNAFVLLATLHNTNFYKESEILKKDVHPSWTGNQAACGSNSGGGIFFLVV